MDRRRLIIAGVAGALVLIAGLAFALVSGNDPEPVTTTTTTTAPTTTTTEKPGPVAPLTGLPVKQKDAALIKRPALVVKIDNANNAARPQSGLLRADVYYEPRVEGGVTRIMAIFHSKDAREIGPIRSFRNTDVNILSALNRPLFAWHGANGIAIQALRAAKADGRVVDVGIDALPSAYYRTSARRAPHNSMSSTKALFAAAPKDSKPPPMLFTFATLGEPVTGGTTIKKANVSYGGGPGSAPIEWRWDAHRKLFMRYQAGTPHVDTRGNQIGVSNVVIQFVTYRDTGQTDVAGNRVPEAQTIGEGEAWILTNGQQFVGRWRKTGPRDITEYLDANGQPILFTPGRTWVNLPPKGTSSVS